MVNLFKKRIKIFKTRYLWAKLGINQKTYDNKEQILEMLSNLKDGKIPSELVPHCPVCGAEMTTNLRIDDRFVEDEEWHSAQRRYHELLQANNGKKILLLELGVGFNTPIIIKIPFMKMTYEYPNAFYISINRDKPYIPLEIASKSLAIQADLHTVISDLI